MQRKRLISMLAAAALCSACGKDGAPAGSTSTPPTSPGSAAISGLVRADLSSFQAGPVAIQSYRVEAGFAKDGKGCTFNTIGACHTMVCAAADPAMPNYGDIAIAGGSGTLQLSPSASGQYPVLTGAKGPWSSGDAVHFTAAGGGTAMGNFDVTLTAPAAMTVASFAGGDWPISQPDLPRSAGLTVAWKGDGLSDAVTVSLAASDEANNVRIACTFPAAVRSAQIPAAAMTLLPKAPGTVTVSSSSVQDINAGETPIEIVVTTTATLENSGAGRLALADVNFR